VTVGERPHQKNGNQFIPTCSRLAARAGCNNSAIQSTEK
jgi:hypothetical protein